MSKLVTIMNGPGDIIFRFGDGSIIKGYPKNYKQAEKLFEAGLSTPNNVAAAVGEAGLRRLAPPGKIDPISEIRMRVMNENKFKQSQPKKIKEK